MYIHMSLLSESMFFQEMSIFVQNFLFGRRGVEQKSLKKFVYPMQFSTDLTPLMKSTQITRKTQTFVPPRTNCFSNKKILNTMHTRSPLLIY
jgi:hypothetical protein